MAASTDLSSLSNLDCWKTTCIDLDLEVQFHRAVVKGSVTLDLKALNNSTSVILDTRQLDIKEVTLSGEQLQYCVKPSTTKAFGSSLEISLKTPVKRDDIVKLTIKYETSPQASGLQWLKPEQTSGKIHPYLYSQFQAIHARSFLPCQDSPSVKVPYTAKVLVPKDLVALMSALRKGEEMVGMDSKRYRFEQPVPMPSYLIAIVVGCLESRPIGPRSLVWSEKEDVEAAQYEFQETENMLKAAESIVGEYVWGQYDLLVLPPTFPYGGMENPCLTFVTPTIIAGDRSLANVVAHEIAHSWTGNLVTNKTWTHFWLNEGNTVFLERKIIRRLQDEKTQEFHALGGWKDLEYSVKTFGADNQLTNLVPDLTGVDPDDAFSSVPYEKGYNLLFYLETILGGPSVFEPFLKSYINKFKGGCVTTNEWKSHLYEFFKDQVEVLDSVNWKAWLYTPGMPPIQPDYDRSLSLPCLKLAQKWMEAESEKLDQFSSNDLADFSAKQTIEFLSQLLLMSESSHLSINHLKTMLKVYQINDNKNAEIKFRWLRLCLMSEWEEAIAWSLEAVTQWGRMKFVRPLYRDLSKFEKAKPLAIETFQKHKSSMHPITANMVTKDLLTDG